MPTEPGSSFTGLPKRFGRYEVVRELGKGAMGVVYLGKDPVIGRLVALKTIRASAEDDLEQREFSERFLREAQAAGTLSHPNIVTVHDVGEEDETSFIAMEYVEGKNLKQLIREKVPFSWDRIAEIIAQVAEALDYAHRRGIVHRDVKPANIIITPDGAVKITDFGIAKIDASSLTETGQFLGTPNYMSPEQVTGEAVDGRSDLFSLGVVLYELLTKKKPFLGDNVTSISYKIVHEDFPALALVDPAIPGEFVSILVRALAKDPGGRYQRGSDFAQALSEYKARQAEIEMIRGLGEMVAQAERLGPVAPVEAAPGASAAPPRPGMPTPEPLQKPSPPTLGPPALEALSRHRRDDLNPQLVASTPMADLDASIPDWSLDTDAVKKSGLREPAPSTPGTMISDVPAGLKKEGPAPETPEPARGGVAPAPTTPAVPASPSSPAAVPGVKADDRTPAKPLESVRPEGRPTPRPVPELDFGGPTRADATGSIRRPPANAEVLSTGPRPPALPQERTGPVPRVSAVPAPGPSPRVPSPRPPAPPVASSPPLAAAPSAAATGPVRTVPAAPRERTAPVRFDAAAPPAEPAPKETIRVTLRRDVNRLWVVLILGAVVALAALIVGLMWQRTRAIAPSKEEAEVAASEESVAANRHLLDEGNRLLAAGQLEEARRSFADLVRRAPESAAARDALRTTERLLSKKAEVDRRNALVGKRLEAARAARENSQWATTVVEADAALALDPEHPEAKALRADAQDAIRKLPKAAQRKAEGEIRALKAAASSVAPPSEAATAAPAGDRPLSISFRSPIPEGWLFVRFGEREVFRQAFDFGRKSGGGLVEGSADLPPGGGEFRVWLFAGDGSVREYATQKVERSGTERRTLVVDLDAARKLVLNVR